MMFHFHYLAAWGTPQQCILLQLLIRDSFPNDTSFRQSRKVSKRSGSKNMENETNVVLCLKKIFTVAHALVRNFYVNAQKIVIITFPCPQLEK